MIVAVLDARPAARPRGFDVLGPVVDEHGGARVEIETTFGLQEWAARLGCSLNVVDRLSEELRKQYTDVEIDEDPAVVTAPALIN